VTQISLNGKPHSLPANGTVASLLVDLGLAGRGGLAVEVNLEVIPRSEHPARVLVEGDKVEIVTMMAGG
jgi:sulfur carrier protein